MVTSGPGLRKKLSFFSFLWAMAYGLRSGLLPQEASVRFAKYYCQYSLFGLQVHVRSINKDVGAVVSFTTCCDAASTSQHQSALPVHHLC